MFSTLFFFLVFGHLIGLSAIKGFLKKDKNVYGGGVYPNVAPEELNPWQQGVDDSLEAQVSASAPLPENFPASTTTGTTVVHST